MSDQPQTPESPVSPPKPKQYLLMVDELNAALLGRVFPAIQMVQIEGINMDGNATHMALVTPKPAPQPVPIQASEAPKVD